MEILRGEDGLDYVSVRDMRDWLQRTEDAIVAECSGAPEGCNETRAYLYGEICSMRVVRKIVAGWIAPKSRQSVGAVDPSAESTGTPTTREKA